MKTYYLYIKTSPLGLKYLGKTTKDPYKYMGSGKLWLRHIKKHSLSYNDIKTEIIFSTTDLEDLKIKGIRISEELDIVKSIEWANLRIENGDGGDTSKFIDFSAPIFHKKGRADHLNGIGLNEEERKKIFNDRSKLINYKDPERNRKIKENTNWENWRNSIKNRKIEYSKFLSDVHRKNKKAVYQYDKDWNFIQEFDSAIGAALALGRKKHNAGTITLCCKGKTETAIGYKWKYKNESK